MEMRVNWGYFTDVEGYTNDYDPAQGDEVGAFWNNGTDDILVGVTWINQSMADDHAYGQLNIFGDDPETHVEASDGLINGAVIFFEVYLPDQSEEYNAHPTLSFQDGGMWTEPNLAVDFPATHTPSATPIHRYSDTLRHSDTPIYHYSHTIGYPITPIHPYSDTVSYPDTPIYCYSHTFDHTVPHLYHSQVLPRSRKGY